MKTILIAMILLTGISCTKTETGSSEKIFDLANTPVTSEVDIIYEDIELNTILLDPIATSSRAILLVNEQELKVIDQDFGKIFVFDHNGSFLNTKLGQGEGPAELPSGLIMFLASNPSNDDIRHIIGGSYDVYEFDGNWERHGFNRIQWIHGKPVDVLAKNPDPTDHRSYNLGYGFFNRLGATSTHLYLPIISSYPTFSDFNLTTDLFASEARVLGRMQLSDGKVDSIFGRLSPMFAEDERFRPFSFFHYEIISEEQMLITYMPDSLIYTIDLPFYVVNAFGRSGTDLNTDYQAYTDVSNENVLRDHWEEERESRGYYTSIRHIPDRNLVFRTYTRGSHAELDGLQIYRDNVLIADVNVPLDFKVADYSEPYFYSEPIYDDNTDQFTVYSFQLNTPLP
ncbi:MAG: hypothetical protein LAT57_09170 [Balneolales bacterium]|nr:hypothetical protein [Balneolales bacterium]